MKLSKLANGYVVWPYAHGYEPSSFVNSRELLYKLGDYYTHNEPHLWIKKSEECRPPSKAFGKCWHADLHYSLLTLAVTVVQSVTTTTHLSLVCHTLLRLLRSYLPLLNFVSAYNLTLTGLVTFDWNFVFLNHIFFSWLDSPSGPRPSLMRFPDHTETHYVQ
jgi:hypothetical protein